MRGEIEARYSGNPETTTKEGARFRVLGIREKAVWVEIESGEWPIRLSVLERAVALIRSGVLFAGPLDFREKVGDERPAYAWAILRDLGYVGQPAEPLGSRSTESSSSGTGAGTTSPSR